MTLHNSPFSSRSRDEQVTICPCCGVKFAGDLSQGCFECGARSVGEPLPKPEHELPSYGRSLLLVVVGALMVLLFLVQFIIALIQRVPFSLSSWSFLMAGETAAWRLKFSIPLALLVLWSCRKIYRSILEEPARFCGLRQARRGLLTSSVVCMLIAGFIGISIPARLRNRQLAIDAAYAAHVHRFDRGFIEYVIRYKTLPSETSDLLKRLPDPDGSLAEAIREVGPLGPSAYKPSGADLAALPNQKPRTLRGAVIRNASVDSTIDDTLTPGLAFTNYELRLPGPDKIPGTDDDLVVRDGLITKAAEAGPGIIGSTASTSATKP
jgi:hypothetical protein